MTIKPLTYIYSLKCLDCGMHFKVFSWYSNWNKLHKANCPECGLQKSVFLLKFEESDKPINKFVEGGMPEIMKNGG